MKDSQTKNLLIVSFFIYCLVKSNCLSTVMQKAPMGWNSWDCYGAAVDEKTVKQNAYFMSKNLLKYGWEYIVVDIQWSGPEAKNHDYIPFQKLNMDDYGRLIPAVNRFPSSVDGAGFKPLADYVHELGLKFGIHIMRGIPRQAAHSSTPILNSDKTAKDIAQANNICAWNPDMYGVDPNNDGARKYYESIFKLYAEWGVDFIKLDDICREMPRFQQELELISDCLQNCGREIVFSISPGPAVLEFSEVYKKTANMWRITDDFWDKWDLLYNMFERAEKWSIHTGAGNWPDADMLPIGPLRQDYDKSDKTKFTEDEQITMMTLWSIFRSPLMIGGEMTSFDEFTMSLLTNEEILKMHSNSRHSHQVWRKKINDIEHTLWTSISSTGGQYIAIFNLGESNSEIEITFAELEISDSNKKMKDLWNGEESIVNEKFSVKLNKHGAKAFLISS